MAASNTIECMETFIGSVVIGVVVNEFGPDTKTFIFQGNRAFTFKSNGAFWSEDQRAVKLVLEKIAQKLLQYDQLLKASAEHVP